jgi:hypothetical protein
MEPAASAKKTIITLWFTQAWPMTVPRNVGPPPIRPSSARKLQLGCSWSPVSGAQMPRPSVALWRPKPMIRTIARLSLSAAADWPIASPSEKLCNPMPVAMKRASQRAGDMPVKWCSCSNSAVEAAPGPRKARRRRRFIQRS